MSQVEILHAAFSPIDYDISRSDNPHDLENVTGNALVHDILSSPSPWHLTADSHRSDSPLQEALFPSLPPLHLGHSEVHLRNGIMNASLMANDGEPDSEKAFFVADLSQIYAQHQRWMACLPEITPHYGLLIKISFFAFSNPCCLFVFSC